jgi:trimethylamine--corrinoid protein Co-methyltransferase
MESKLARRSGGRSRKSIRQSKKAIDQLDWSIPYNTDNFIEPLNTDGIEAIDDAAMQVIEEIGIQFLNEEAKSILIEAGCKVDQNSSNVIMDRHWVKEMVAKAPTEFEIIPRNPEKSVKIGGRNMAFVNVSSPPNVMDLDRGRRVGDFESFKDLMKLTQYFNCIHLAGGYPVEPVDIHASIRHLDCLYEKLTLTDKVCHAYSLGSQRVEDALEMAKIASGLTENEFFSKPRFYTNINSSSPLKHDQPMLDGAMRFARRGQPVIVTPFTLAGAMAPVTMAGAVVQSVAEGLAAIALLQYINPGTPCVFGTFTSNVDMKSGAPAFGTPEYIRATQMSGQMARYYGLPIRASNACAANAPDGQAMWESLNSMWAASTSGINVVYHSAGWLEGGLIASYEKFIMDCEVLQQFQKYFDPKISDVGTGSLALEAIKEVGPNGHFFGCDHTQERYSDAFYSPFLSDWRNYEAWEQDGSEWTHQRANKIWKKILKEFEPPEMDISINEELASFVEKRKSEGGVKTDF